MSSHSDHSHSDAPDPSAVFHRARVALLPTLTVAAALIALHQEGTAFLIGAVAAVLLTFGFMGMAAAHKWDVCPHCDGPPKKYATEEARAKVARRIHNKALIRVERVFFTLVLASALLPKPYLDHWWGILAAFGVYLTAGLMFIVHGTEAVTHRDNYRDECHLESCRAKRKRPRPFFVWLGHYGPWFLAVLIPGTLTMGIMALHRDRWWQLGYAYALVLLALVVTAMIFDHLDTPCLRCGKLPLNAEELAEKRMFWLRVHHVFRYKLPIAAVLWWLVSWFFPGTLAGRILVGVAVFCLIPWTVLSRLHSPVQPWCPWCRDPGGESETEDVPDPSTNQPLPV